GRVPDARGGRPGDPLHRSAGRAVDEPLHESPDRVAARVLRRGVMADPELWKQAIHPDDRDRVSLANEESNRNAERYLDEYRIITKDGRTVWIRDEAAPVRGLDGALLYWRGVMLDITDRKEAEEKLRWSLDVLRRTLQQRR